MRFLPEKFRKGISTAYLLARATDTIADTAQSSGESRLECLQLMGESIESTNDSLHIPENLTRLLKDKFSPTQEHQGEAELLNRFNEVLALLSSLSPDERDAVKTMLRTIVQGQSLDLKRFDCTEPFDTKNITDLGLPLRRLSSRNALLEYTYLVAGCVGEFWTRLGFIHYGKRYARKSEETMMKLGREFGQGLQLVNILRDVYEDKERGRIYLPDDNIQEWIYQARNYLNSGFKYAKAVRGFRMSFAVRLPADLGFKTLDCLPQIDPDLPKPKITRNQVYASLVKSIALSSLP